MTRTVPAHRHARHQGPGDRVPARSAAGARAVGTIVADSGILGEPLDIVPDVTRAEVARLGGHDDRGAAAGGQPRQGRARDARRAARARARSLSRRPAARRGDARRRGGRGARRERDDGAADRRAQDHRHADRVGPSPLRAARRHARRHGRALGDRHPRAESDQHARSSTTSPRRSPAWLQHGAAADDRPTASGASAITMLGNTTKAVMTMRDALRAARARGGHLPLERRRRPGDGGTGRRRAVRRRDRLHDRRADRRDSVGGFHDGRPGSAAARSAGWACRRSWCPAASISPCTAGPKTMPPRLQGRPDVHAQSGVHARAHVCRRDGASSGAIFAERLNEATGPVERDGADRGPVDPERAGRRVLGSRRPTPAFSPSCGAHLRADIPDPRLGDCHINAPEFARAVADRLRRAALLSRKDTRS